MKSILIIAYSYAEDNMGAIRLRRMTRHLADNGYAPVVITHSAPPQDVLHASGRVRVLQARGVNLARLYARLRHPWGRGVRTPAGSVAAHSKSTRLTTLLNRWVVIPDKQFTWIGPALATARAFLRREPVDVLMASQPVRSNLVVGTRLAREFSLPYLVEYRDLWTGNPFHHAAQPTRLHQWLHVRLERDALRQATRVTCVCRALGAYLQRQYGSLIRSDIAINYNFFDPLEFPAHPAPPESGAKPWVVSYMGSMYLSRGPSSFLGGLKLFLERQRITPEAFRFRWAGAIAGIPGLEQLIGGLGLQPYIDFLGQVPHARALDELIHSDVALVLQAPNDNVHIPGKLFEAMGAGRPVLLVANDCEAADITRAGPWGLVCSPESEAVCAALRELYMLRQRGQPWVGEEPMKSRFHIDTAMREMVRLLDSTVTMARRVNS